MLRIAATIVLGLVPAFAQEETRSAQYATDGIEVPGAYADEPLAAFSAQRAANYLNGGAVAWSRQKGCVTCHTNGTYGVIRPALTKELGAPNKEVRDFYISELNEFRKVKVEDLYSGTNSAQVIYIAAGLAEWDAHVTGELSEETNEALRLMFSAQQESGTWTSLDCWPPFESSAYQEATVAAMAIGTAPGWLKSVEQDEELSTSVNLLKKYLRETQAPHEYAQVLRLWAANRVEGLVSESQQKSALKMLTEKQNADGGWSLRDFAKPEQWGGGNRAQKLKSEPEFEDPPSDGHMTGLALIVLQANGLSADGQVIQRGVKWLKENQRKSGRWWTRSLNTDGPHYITYSGTAYPMLALKLAGELEVTGDK